MKSRGLVFATGFFVQHRDGPRINDVRIKNLPSGNLAWLMYG